MEGEDSYKKERRMQRDSGSPTRVGRRVRVPTPNTPKGERERCGRERDVTE